ncbi:hypothetical protein [Desulfobacula sp.]|uniref:hypothetical protein n=1 Tax=Desulfobacula sp. TaxID=2593537 RepID=UPI002617088F|nr:hypothetical protein [Desulfobacula sp.]
MPHPIQSLNVTRFICLFAVCLILSGCALMRQPDSCNQDSLCRLEDKETEPAIELELREIKNVTICACRPWNPGAVKVKEGESYTFEIEAVHNWVDGDVESDPETGWHGSFYRTIWFLSGFLKRSSKTGWYVLTGTIGMMDGKTFAVITPGNEPVNMPDNGELYFYANDMKGRYFNNKGKISLKITRIR